MYNKLIAYPTHWVGIFFWRGGNLLKSGRRGPDKGWKPDLV